jgi:general stress protein 26
MDEKIFGITFENVNETSFVIERANHKKDFKQLQQKIQGMQSAIMYTLSNSLIKLPNSLITLLEIDDEDQIWFQCKAPMTYVHQYENCFPAKLHFFQQGCNYFVDVDGMTTIVNHAIDKHDKQNKLLTLKMDIAHSECVDLYAKKRNRFDQWLEAAYNWVLHHIAIPRFSKTSFPKLQHNNR